MLGGIFHKRKKSQELRSPSLQDLKKFRDAYAKYAELRQVETPPCFEKSIYKAIAGQKELHTIDFRQEDITDPQMIALAEALLDMPIVSSLDLRDNRISNDGAKALLEVLRLQIIAAKTPPISDPRTKQPLYPPLPEYTRYVTNVNLKGNEVSASVLQELSQYIDVLRREDKRLEIRMALTRIDRNKDGGIDEEEFKSVLKLLTSATPTKKEIRAFMQQHTLSTDSTQNVVNLENVLLAKCAVSPSRHAACPPWEALVQERHAILGASRMAPTIMVPESRSGKVNHFIHSSFPDDVSPLSSPSSLVAPVAPIETTNTVMKPPPAPVISVPVVAQQPHATTKVFESKSVAISSDQPASIKRPPPIPILPLASLIQQSTSPSPRSARSSIDDDGQRNPTKHSVTPSPRSTGSTVDTEGQRNPPLTGPNPVISAPSSPHDSDMSDSMSVVSSAFGGSVSQRLLDDHDRSIGTERKTYPAPPLNLFSTTRESPRWQSGHFSKDDDDGANSSAISAAREAEDMSMSVGETNDDVRSVASYRPLKSIITSASSSNELSDNKSISGPFRRENSFSSSEISRELVPKESEHSSSAGHDDKRSLPGSIASSLRLDDLSSLVYRGAQDGDRVAVFNCNTDCIPNQPEEDEEVEGCVDSVVFDVIKDGKERFVVKLVHSEFRSGLTIKEFPVELPFRNLLALLLPENGLTDLSLFTECRFPFVIVLDLSRNKLVKLPDDGLIAFPRLEVLNLSDNQLRTITGLTKTLRLRALSLSHNAIRTVKNVEHLVQLEILQLAHNQIATVHALRLLSLNKVLTHLNLNGNPVVETDERQKRKNTVYVRNLLPALQSLGSIPCAGLLIKDKKKANSAANPGKCLFESDLIPDYKTLWVSIACDTLHILQDVVSHNSGQSQHDDDEWDTRDEDGGEDRPKKPLTREQQRQKDELRSRAIGFRSRGKAIPSPPKMKTSVYSFGPPQPGPVKKMKKKPALVDPSVVREQQRRASELSAPKHTPVDKTLMHQEQKRQSRVNFQGAMTVGERLQLARDMTQRRPTGTLGLSVRSRSILAKVESRKRASDASATSIKEGPEVIPKTASRSPSPHRSSPLKDAMVFRIDPANTPRSPKGVLTFRVDPYPPGMEKSSSPPTNSSKEASFLHDLAVSDFLNHAKEEFSTALTALNVLLSMSEKEQGDRKKLVDYRASLDALDILNEHESYELFTNAQGQHEHELQAQCTEWFTKLGIVKKCMRQLLEKLQIHAPGSGVIRAFCRWIRSNELRGIITTMIQAEEDTLNQPNAAEMIDVEKEESVLEQEHELANDAHDENPNPTQPASGSVNSSLVGATSSLAHDDDNANSQLPGTPQNVVPSDNRTCDFSAKDVNVDFLESTDSVLSEDKNVDVKADEPVSQLFVDDETCASDSARLAATTDITMDIQMNDLTDSNQNSNETKGGESHDQSTFDRTGDDSSALVEAVATQSEDYEWLVESIELDAESEKRDSFEQEMAAVSGDEENGEAVLQEQAEADHWEVNESTIQEEVEVSMESYDGESYNTEEINAVEDNGKYTGDGQVVTEEMDITEAQYELGEGVDADDEEAETFGDWEKGFDPNSNHYFWFNHSTGESSWTPPDGWPYDLDEPFSTEDESGGAEEQQEQDDECEVGTAEYEETGTEYQTYGEGTVERGYYEEGAGGEEGAAEGQYYEDPAVEGQEYKENADGQGYQEHTAQEQQYEEATGGGQWYDETTAEGQEYTIEDQRSEVAAEEEQGAQVGEESPRHSEVSDFEFDDSDLPGF